MAKMKAEDQAALVALAGNHRRNQPDGETKARLLKAGLVDNRLGVAVINDKGRKALESAAKSDDK